MTTAPVCGCLRNPEGPSPRWCVIRSEWTKLVTVRSTVWMTVALTAVVVGVGSLLAVALSSGAAHVTTGGGVLDPTALSLFGLRVGQIVAAVLGVLVVTTEFSTGTIRATLVAVPIRRRLLMAKAITLGGLMFLFGEVASLLAFLSGQVILSGHEPTTTLAHWDVLRAVFFGGVLVGAVGLIGLGLGLIIRQSSGGIVAAIGLLLVVPSVMASIPGGAAKLVDDLLPYTLTASMVAVLPGSRWSPWSALLMLAVYVVVALGVGGWLFARRDA